MLFNGVLTLCLTLIQPQMAAPGPLPAGPPAAPPAPVPPVAAVAPGPVPNGAALAFYIQMHNAPQYVSDYEPSIHRGPGTIDDTAEAKTICQQASQFETLSKKRKIQYDTTRFLSKANIDVAVELGGEGAKIGGYYRGRAKLSKKGTPMGNTTVDTLNKVYTPVDARDLEDWVCAADEKWNVGDQYEEGTNYSPQVDSRRAVAMGLKAALRGKIDQARGLRLANFGVFMIQQFRNELQAQHPNGPPPSMSELKAAMQLSLLNGFENEGRAQQDMIPVDDDIFAG